MHTSIINLEYFGAVSIYFGLGIEILAAVLCGGIIGLDRERKMKSAGIKTNILICLGATLYTAISLLNTHNAAGQTTDPNRTAAQIVSGIGFLGAGAIMQAKGKVVGLTTAATIWVVAAVGVTIGIGYPIIAGIFSLTCLFVLNMVTPFYHMFERAKDYKLYNIEVLTRGPAKANIKEVVLSEIKSIEEVYEEILNNDLDERILNIKLKIHPHHIKDLVHNLKLILRVEQVSFRIIPDFIYDDEE